MSPAKPFRRALAGLLGAAVLMCVVPTANAQPRRNRPPPQFLQKDQPDQAEGGRILARFRAAGIAGTYWLEFELTAMPRQGPERTLQGDLFGARNDLGPISRLSLAPAPQKTGAATPASRWLLQSGPQPAAWRAAGAGGVVEPLPEAEWLQPIAQTDLTPFDLQMPFLYWSDFVFEGAAKVRGRNAHSFIVYPPAALAAQHPSLHGVRVLLDTEFNALLQAGLLGDGGKTEKTITVLELKKLGEKWIVKSIDLRNETTRDKTRFTVTAAALDLALPPGAFTPEQLAGPTPAVPPKAIQRF